MSSENSTQKTFPFVLNEKNAIEFIGLSPNFVREHMLFKSPYKVINGKKYWVRPVLEEYLSNQWMLEK